MPILVTDFDGTFARRDFFDLILERHNPPGARAGWQQFLDGKVTLTEGLNAVFTTLRTDEAGVAALVAALDPAPGTAAAVRRLQAAGWEIEVASAGCGWYIERLLQGLDLKITVHASPGVFAPDSGLRMTPDPRRPFHHPSTGIDKPAVVRAALARDLQVAYAGDSTTDRAAALLAAPAQRFATGWLARRFAADEIPHVPFRAWPEIVDHLLGS